jgi:putative Holliday junction resolvase
MHEHPVGRVSATFLATASSLASPTPSPAESTVLGFDFGERYIGVAVGDTETGLAHPLSLIDDEANAPRFARIAMLIAEWRPARLVVGLPLAMDGTEHDLSRRARRFANQLQGRTGLAVDLADERLSSAAAEDLLRERGRGGRAHKHEAHALAAQVILQAWLDERAARPGRGES